MFLPSQLVPLLKYLSYDLITLLLLHHTVVYNKLMWSCPRFLKVFHAACHVIAIS